MKAILGKLPHRYPFLLIDRVLEYSKGHAKCLKNVTCNEPWVQGHFPEEPLFPATHLLEAMAQTCGIALYNNAEVQGKLGVFAGVDGFRVRQPIVPGDSVEITADYVRHRGRLYQFEVRVEVRDQEVAEASKLLVSFVDPLSPE